MNQEKREKIASIFREYGLLLILALSIVGLGLAITVGRTINGDVLASVPPLLTSIPSIPGADWTDQAILYPLSDAPTNLLPMEARTWLPIILTSDITQSRNITDDFNAHAILVSCGTYLEEYGEIWDDAYNCTGQFKGITQIRAFKALIVGRKHSSYTGNNIHRTFIEYPIPNDISPDQVIGVQFCLNTYLRTPETVYVHSGTWTPGLIAEIAQTHPVNLEDYYDIFFPDAWNSRGDAFFTIPPLLPYHYGLPCTEVTIPVASDDGFIRWVLRTADDDYPPEGTWGLSNYTVVDGSHVYTDIYLIYQP